MNIRSSCSAAIRMMLRHMSADGQTCCCFRRQLSLRLILLPPRALLKALFAA